MAAAVKTIRQFGRKGWAVFTKTDLLRSVFSGCPERALNASLTRLAQQTG